MTRVGGDRRMRGGGWGALSGMLALPAILATLLVAMGPALSRAESAGPPTLPPPLVTANSVEMCLNSRYSQHTLAKTNAGAQQLSNILWAAGKAPVIGPYRNILVATSAGTYLYNPADHSLSRRSDEVVSEGALAISYETGLAFDAGVSYMPALLASVSLCQSSEAPVASCPKQTKVFFAAQAGPALTSTLTAHSSVPPGQPGWLPDPVTAGNNRLEDVLAHLQYVRGFAQTDLTLPQISQILWAGYGCTAHMSTNGRAGLTVPSAMATYYLTRSIYLVNETGVHRYHDRNPPTSTATRDHRLELLGSAPDSRRPPPAEPPPADARAGLRAAVSALPVAPCYVVLCLDSSYVGQLYAQLETGFVAGNMLIQATALGLGCHFQIVTPAEERGVRTATGIPAAHVPQVIVSVGPVAVVGVLVSVALPGDVRPEINQAVPMTIQFFMPGADVLHDTPAYEFHLAAARPADGNAVVCETPGVAPGAYDVTIFGEHTLMNVKREVAVSEPNTPVDLGMLLAGNANGDDIIDWGDWAILSRSWRMSATQAQYDARADFDANGLINAADLALLAANWLRNSPIEIRP
jgi:hypothetical protein